MYASPTKLIRFLLQHGVSLEACFDGSDVDYDEELVTQVISSADEFARGVFSPLNPVGDRHPPTLVDKAVVTSPGFQEAYAQYVEAGWQSLSVPVHYGGMGLPNTLAAVTCEFFCSANVALNLAPTLTGSAIKTLIAHGSDAQKDTYLPRMVTGAWSGTMDLTEPQSGSDLGGIRTKAVETADGSYELTGQKIYITWGDHDCADNIVHFVLARIVGAPKGTQGLSLFLCPKFLPTKTGTPGERNRFWATGLEDKLGIHGSPTCTMTFEGASAQLVGQKGRGLSAMFTMMNEARLLTGVQGIGIGERAYQAALAFARNRVQGTPIGRAKGDAIEHHPDVRATLASMKTRLLGARMICLATTEAADCGMEGREALLTPIAKAYSTDVGMSVASMGIQVHGGMGFIEETGVAQYYRDARIGPIYEGTNGIQAIDLVMRKIRRDGGRAAFDLLEDFERVFDHVSIKTASPLIASLKTLRDSIEHILRVDDVTALCVATPFLGQFAKTIAQAYLEKAVLRARQSGEAQSDAVAKLVALHGYMLLAESAADARKVRSGLPHLMDLLDATLADL